MAAERKKIFYGWYIAAVCFMLELVAQGLGIGSSNLYIKPVCDDLGFSRVAFSVVFSIMSLLNTIVGMTYGIIQRVVKFRTMLLVGAVCEAAAYLTYHYAATLPVFYLGSVLMGIGLMYLGTIPLAMVISNWFTKNRGAVLGLVFAGSGVGGAILNPLVSGWIERYGWRTGYLISMMLVLAFSLPALFFIREKPSDKGLAALGDEEQTASERDIVNGGMPGFTWREALAKPEFWLLATAAMLLGMSIQPVFLSAPAYLAGEGIAGHTVGLAMGLVYFLNLVGKVGLGRINDRFGLRHVLVISHLSFYIAALLLLFAKSGIAAYAFAVFFGIAAVAISLPLPLLAGLLFGQKDYGTLLGILLGAYSIGVSIGTPIDSLSFDLFHTYRYAFVLNIMLDLISVALFLYVVRGGARISQRAKA